MLLSFKADVFERVKSGEKIYEHRRVFPNESVKAYLYISTPVKAIVGIMRLDNRVQIESWKKKYSYDEATLSRIDNYLSKHTVATPLHTDWFLSWDSMYGNMLITWITRTAVPII